MSILDSKKQLHRYIVTEVGGCMIGKVEVGATIIDTWHGKHGDWNIYDIAKGEHTGFFCGLHDSKITPEELAEMRERSSD